jgi:DNA-binding MarR family transcriptional regulator
MEKIGLVTSGANTEDARVKMVTITKSGEEKMQEAKERLELFLTEILAGASSKEIENTTNLLFSVGGKVLMN